MKNLLLMCALFTSACFDTPPEDAPMTWEDAYTEISAVYCGEYYNRCGDGESQEQEWVCVKHAVLHGCGLSESCGYRVADELIPIVGECVSAVLEQSCAYFIHGLLPQECAPLY